MTHSSTFASPRPSPGGDGPVPISQRHLAPDLARGIMLLVIALAHAHFFATIIGGAGPADSAVDRVADGFNAMFVQARGYPMFAALFGYGLVQIRRRLAARKVEWPRIRSLLRTRARWLIIFGLVHAVLLFPGDILTVYGVLALIMVGAVRRRTGTLVVLAAAWLPIGGLMHGVIAAEAAISGTDGLPPVPMSDGLVGELVWRLGMFAVLVVSSGISTVFPMLVGILAARFRLLEEPRQHRFLLRVVAYAGIPVGILGGLPLALSTTGVWADQSALSAGLAAGLHQVTGYAAGFGYAAIIALFAARFTDRKAPLTTALAALGQRSMTFYLVQSIAWAVLFASYGLHLQVTSTVVAAGIGVAVWFLTVVLAARMSTRGIRGPAETALRKLTYRARRST